MAEIYIEPPTLGQFTAHPSLHSLFNHPIVPAHPFPPWFARGRCFGGISGKPKGCNTRIAYRHEGQHHFLKSPFVASESNYSFTSFRVLAGANLVGDQWVMLLTRPTVRDLGSTYSRRSHLHRALAHPSNNTTTLAIPSLGVYLRSSRIPKTLQVCPYRSSPRLPRTGRRLATQSSNHRLVPSVSAFRGSAHAMCLGAFLRWQ